jgi:hypothetical protein
MNATSSRHNFWGQTGLFAALGLAKVATRLAADETMHFTIFSHALGRPLPSNALSFGA